MHLFIRRASFIYITNKKTKVQVWQKNARISGHLKSQVGVIIMAQQARVYAVLHQWHLHER